MKNMKLIMENWKRYTEEDLREQIANYIEENNIVLTEEQINEAMPRWLKKLGTGAALASTLAGTTAPSMAHAKPRSEPVTQQVQDEASLPTEVQAALEELGKTEKEVGIGSYLIAFDMPLALEHADAAARKNSPAGKEILQRVQVGNTLYSIAGAK